MLKTPIQRLAQTTKHIIRTTTTAANMSSNDGEPTGLIANKGIELLTFGTPNGHKVNIMLEELKEAYGKDYTYQSINIGKNTQKQEWYTKLGPNGRIPVIVDHDRGSFPVQEGSAILTYLTRHYDPEHKFTFTDPDDLSRCEQWLEWQHGGLGPMQGQANHFYRLAKERIPYPTQRYVGESERLYGILDKQLEGRDYLVGPGKGKYSIADIANFSWGNIAYFSGVDIKTFPNVSKWLDRIAARPAVKKGVAIPSEPQVTNEAYQRRLKEEDGFADKEKELKDLLKKAQQQYDYKYSSP